MTAYMYKFASGNTRLDSLIAGLVDELEKLGAGEPYLRRTARPPDRSRARSAAHRPAPASAPAPAPRPAPPPAPAPAPQQAQPAPQPAPQQTQPAPAPQPAPQQAPAQQQQAAPAAKPTLAQTAVDKATEQGYRGVIRLGMGYLGGMMPGIGEAISEYIPKEVTQYALLPAAAALGAPFLAKGVSRIAPALRRGAVNAGKFLSNVGNSFINHFKSPPAPGPVGIGWRSITPQRPNQPAVPQPATQQPNPVPQQGAPMQPDMQKAAAFRDYMFYKLAAKYDNLGDAINAVKNQSKKVIGGTRLGIEIINRMEKRIKESKLDPVDMAIALERAPGIQVDRIFKRLDRDDK